MVKKAKNLGISMATRAVSLARELKSMRSYLCLVQERCALLEEESRRLRHGMAEGIRPEEDDLVRLLVEWRHFLPIYPAFLRLSTGALLENSSNGS